MITCVLCAEFFTNCDTMDVYDDCKYIKNYLINESSIFKSVVTSTKVWHMVLLPNDKKMMTQMKVSGVIFTEIFAL